MFLRGLRASFFDPVFRFCEKGYRHPLEYGIYSSTQIKQTHIFKEYLSGYPPSTVKGGFVVKGKIKKGSLCLILTICILMLNAYDHLSVSAAGTEQSGVVARQAIRHVHGDENSFCYNDVMFICGGSLIPSYDEKGKKVYTCQKCGRTWLMEGETCHGISQELRLVCTTDILGILYIERSFTGDDIILSAGLEERSIYMDEYDLSWGTSGSGADIVIPAGSGGTYTLTLNYHDYLRESWYSTTLSYTVSGREENEEKKEPENKEENGEETPEEEKEEEGGEETPEEEKEEEGGEETPEEEKEEEGGEETPEEEKEEEGGEETPEEEKKDEEKKDNEKKKAVVKKKTEEEKAPENKEESPGEEENGGDEEQESSEDGSSDEGAEEDRSVSADSASDNSVSNNTAVKKTVIRETKIDDGGISPDGSKNETDNEADMMPVTEALEAAGEDDKETEPEEETSISVNEVATVMNLSSGRGEDPGKVQSKMPQLKPGLPKAAKAGVAAAGGIGSVLAIYAGFVYLMAMAEVDSIRPDGSKKRLCKLSIQSEKGKAFMIRLDKAVQERCETDRIRLKLPLLFVLCYKDHAIIVQSRGKLQEKRIGREIYVNI